MGTLSEKKKEVMREVLKLNQGFLVFLVVVFFFNYKERKPPTFQIAVIKFAKISPSLQLCKNI